MEKKVLGRKEKITLPELGLNLVGAKIDSGAYTSSLHAEEIRIEEVSGKKLLYFKILMPDHQKYTGKTLAFDSFREKKVKNSFGQAEVRYLIETK
ncbi:MAG: ATP-dependent zinc protease, partial [Algoriphagus sp.]|nr:ATP-dependent zinc protease [Algoriphagus sp.]MDP4905294.1 ATP-dependent zinc protease [Algoriphagus sp.]MDP5126262.1 ATP-dependent zinc protease [Algoriphagus sp.]